MFRKIWLKQLRRKLCSWYCHSWSGVSRLRRPRNGYEYPFGAGSDLIRPYSIPTSKIGDKDACLGQDDDEDSVAAAFRQTVQYRLSTCHSIENRHTFVDNWWAWFCRKRLVTAPGICRRLFLLYLKLSAVLKGLHIKAADWKFAIVRSFQPSHCRWRSVLGTRYYKHKPTGPSLNAPCFHSLQGRLLFLLTSGFPILNSEFNYINIFLADPIFADALW